jgi:hypothetical protein
MTDRERLIDILVYHWFDGMTMGECADMLIANGVIVPPCKVGDTVYRIAKDGKTITEERVGEIHLEYTIDDGTGWHNVWWLKEYNIGVTTFLTKEEAKNALKEREAGAV